MHQNCVRKMCVFVSNHCAMPPFFLLWNWPFVEKNVDVCAERLRYVGVLLHSFDFGFKFYNNYKFRISSPSLNE